MSMFKPAIREKLKARIALDGPSGSGKSATALRFALGLLKPETIAAALKDPAVLKKAIAIIDTEHRSATKYVGEQYSEAEPSFAFSVVDLVHYAPSAYKTCIEDAGEAGFEVLIIDSLSHAWEGKGGALAIVDSKASQKGGKFGAWRDVTPMHRDLIEAILSSPCHVIATMRTKTEFAVEEDDRGKMRPTKIGTKPIQRDGVEYEFDVVGDMDLSHTLSISKTRCSAIDQAKATKPGADFLRPFVTWLDRGAEPVPFEPTSVSEGVSNADPQSMVATPAKKNGLVMDGSQSQTSAHVSEPCGEVFAQEIRDLMAEAKLDEAAIAKIKGFVASTGCKSLAEVPLDDARKLKAKIAEKVAKDRF